MNEKLIIRDAYKSEHQVLGALMIDVYSNLDGFPDQQQQPNYYRMLANLGEFSALSDTHILAALSDDSKLVGGVVYFGDMSVYGSGGTAPQEINASGIRLLAVDPLCRGIGAGKALTNACIQLAESRHHSHVVLHTTRAMKTAWRLYEKMGFERASDLDFNQQDLPVFGFRLRLNPEIT